MTESPRLAYYLKYLSHHWKRFHWKQSLKYARFCSLALYDCKIPSYLDLMLGIHELTLLNGILEVFMLGSNY